MILIPFVLGILLFVMMVGFTAFSVSAAAVSGALSAAQGAGQSTVVKAIVILGGVIAFVYAWQIIPEPTSRGVEQMLEYSILLALSSAAATLVLLTNAATLRAVSYALKRSGVVGVGKIGALSCASLVASALGIRTATLMVAAII
ncbi:hypothetical protein GCM10007989_24500 [Devosia pacifica]|uniref:Uncharacterized protein n=2 Tax=Devosia pacifica TaxID=1335967 RepID=A0A918VTK2_9HYPH|nr:hypothetical protein GCM10007989_24500 [Devosia pacifica]